MPCTNWPQGLGPAPLNAELRSNLLLILVLAAGSLFGCAGPAPGPVASSSHLEEATIAGIHRAFSEGSLNCQGLIDGYLRRIDAYDRAGPRLNSLISLAPDAIEQAKALDRRYLTGGLEGPLHCIPVVLKDNVETYDMPTTAGSLLLLDLPPADADITARLRAAGAIILGKGNMDEWAHGGAGGYSSAGGQTRNPYKLTALPGSSSGGPAVAVSANLTMLGIGTDTQGSIRGPVAYNHLVGIKPTMGLLSRVGIVPFSLSLDAAGPMTRTVRDAAIMMNAMASSGQDIGGWGWEHEVQDHTARLDPDALTGARIGVLRTYLDDSPVLEAAIQTLRELGAEIVDPVEAPASMRTLSADNYAIISQTEFRNQLGEYLDARRPDAAVRSHADVLRASEDEGFPIAPEVLARLRAESERGTLKDPAYLAAVGSAPAAMRDEIDSMLEANSLSALVHGLSGSALASFSGYPSVMVPAGVDASGNPQSLQFLGVPFSEPLLLGYAYAFEQATRHRIPPATVPPLGNR
jgi:amidase